MYGHPADGWAYNRIINCLQEELIPNKKGIPKPYLRKPKSEETKKKMSAAAKGRKKPQAAVEKMRKSLTGRPPTEKQLECLALGRKRPEGYVSPLKGVRRETPWLIGRTPANKGQKASDETRAKLSAAKKGRKQTPEQIAKRVAARKATLAAQGRTN